METRDLVIERYRIDPNIKFKTRQEYEGMHIPDDRANDIYSDLARNNDPFCAAKIGMVEAMSLRAFLLGRQNKTPTNYNSVARLLHVNAGVFPASQESFDLFNQEFISHVRDLDFFGMWMFGDEPQSITEKEMYEKYARKSRVVHAGSWDPFTQVFGGCEAPWTQELEGKTVLVISPFIETIKKQYERREKIWENPHILPKYNLKVIKCPLSHALKESKFFSWIDGLNNMKEQMNSTEFDVCFVGAGAWGLPLAVHAKRLGKIGIHSGGDTQLMYGIEGRRWDNNSLIQKSVNEHWVRPSKDETPDNKGNVENGCYW